MNKIETALVNSFARRALQRWYEAPLLTRLGGRVPGARVLEIGCGSGYGTRLIFDRFGAATVDAIDLNPQAVAAAQRRLAGYGGRVRVAVGSATDLAASIGAGDAAYDAVFDFAAVHHVEDWRVALAEVARVTRPGGRFVFDEVTAMALARPTYRRLFDHPREDRFTAGDFLAELHRLGLYVGENWRTRVGGDYLLGVAERREAPARETPGGQTKGSSADERGTTRSPLTHRERQTS